MDVIRRRRVLERRCIPLIVAALSSTACLDVEPTATSENITRSWPAEFQLSAWVAPSAEEPAVLTWDIIVSIDPGLEEGVLRGTSDTLMVDSKPLITTRVGRTGIRYWEAEVEVAADEVHERAVTVVPPRVAGLPPPGMMRIVGIGAAAGDTVSWTRGTDLVIPITLPAQQGDDWPAVWRWSLRVSHGDSAAFTIGGTGLPAANVLAPGDYLPDYPLLEARFSYTADLGKWSESEPYRVYGSVGGTQRWVVKALPGPKAPDR